MTRSSTTQPIKTISPFELYNTLLNINPSDSEFKVILLDLRSQDLFKNHGHIDSAMNLPIADLKQHCSYLFTQRHHPDAFKIILTRNFLNRFKMWPKLTMIVYHEDETVIPELVQMIYELLDAQLPEVNIGELEFVMLNNLASFKQRYGKLFWTELNTTKRFPQNALESICNTAYANEIQEGFLFLGGTAHATDEYMMDALNIRHVLTVRRFDEVALDDSIFARYSSRLEIVIGEEERVFDKFEQAILFIQQVKQQYAGEGLLVHDTFGLINSAAIIVAYLLKVEQCNLIEAVATLKRYRKIARLNPDLLEQLAEFEIDLLQ